MATKQRLAWPDAARGLAILLVVMHHAIHYANNAGLALQFWYELTEFLRTMRMPLFFLAAGLFAGKWATAPWRNLLRSKVLLLLWVFVLWVVLRWAWYKLIPGAGQDRGVLGIAADVLLPTAGWFLVTLAAFFVIARATNRIPKPVQLTVSGMVSVLALSNMVALGNHAYDGVLEYYFFFLAGMLYKAFILALPDRLHWSVGIAAVAVWIGAYLVVDGAHLVNAIGISFLLRVLGAAAGISIAAALSSRRSLRYFGQNTLPIYMSHSMIIYAAVWVAVALGAGAIPGVGLWMPIALFTIALAGSLGLGLLAPRIHAGWLFATPRWLHRLFDAVWPARKNPSPATAGG